jgi:putative transposase
VPAAGRCRGGCPTPLATDFCIEAVQEAMHRHGKPEIFNTDSQFISMEFTRLLKANGIAISMDGRGC